jgi:hypothetical protein
MTTPLSATTIDQRVTIFVDRASGIGRPAQVMPRRAKECTAQAFTDPLNEDELLFDSRRDDDDRLQ